MEEKKMEEKLRKFACLCGRKVWHLLSEEGRNAVTTAEKYAAATKEDIEAARSEVYNVIPLWDPPRGLALHVALDTIIDDPEIAALAAIGDAPAVIAMAEVGPAGFVSNDNRWIEAYSRARRELEEEFVTMILL